MRSFRDFQGFEYGLCSFLHLLIVSHYFDIGVDRFDVFHSVSIVVF